LRGKPLSKEHRLKLSKSHKGKRLSEEHKRKIAKALLGKNRGCNNGSWKGGVITSSGGYVLIHCPNNPMANSSGYVLRSRLLMSEHLNRVLKPNEEVHHRNGIRSDDRLENLRLFSSKTYHALYDKLGLVTLERDSKCILGPKVIICDGGIIRGKAYYSFLYYEDGYIQKGEKVSSEGATNNESEYLSLINTIKSVSLHREIEGAHVFMDSKLVIEQLLGHWKVEARNLTDLYLIAKKQINQYNLELKWVSGEVVKQILGH
jgi:ribonuclease HI